MANKYLGLIGTVMQEIAGLVTSAGTDDAGKIVATGTDGLLDLSVMPTGIGPDTSTLPVSEDIAAGALVNLWDDSGTVKARNADNTVAGKEARGFVLSAVLSGANALVYFAGEISGLSGLTLAAPYFLGTTGVPVAAAPSDAGNIYQEVGVAVSATVLAFRPGTPITRG